MKSGLNQELQKILAYKLNGVRESPLKYKFYGSSGVVNNIPTTLGTLILNREKIDNDSAIDAINKILKVMDKINTIVSFCSNSGVFIGEICKKITGK